MNVTCHIWILNYRFLKWGVEDSDFELPLLREAELEKGILASGAHQCVVFEKGGMQLNGGDTMDDDSISEGRSGNENMCLLILKMFLEGR